MIKNHNNRNFLFLRGYRRRVQLGSAGCGETRRPACRQAGIQGRFAAGAKRARPSKTKSRGYIAIMSALIISIIISIVLVSLGQMAFFSRINISDAHLKEKSRALSEACVDTALLKLVSSSVYAGNETITVASDTCRIVSVVSSSTGRIITTQGLYRDSYTNLRVTVATATVTIIGWEETRN